MSIKTATHHYVPRCYLENFLCEKSNNQIYGYKKSGEIIKSNIKNIAAKNNLYTFTDKTTGKKTNIVEKMFGIIESAACPVIKNVIVNKDINLTDADRGAIAQFTAFLVTRNLYYDTQQKHMTAELIKQMSIERAKHKESFKHSFKDAGITFDSDKEFEDLRDAVLDFDNHFKVDISGGEGHFMKVATDIAMELTNILYFKEWHLLINDGSRVFITSDNPVTLWGLKSTPKQFRLGFAFASILLTLSPDVLLLMRDRLLSKTIIKLNREKIDYVNKSIMKGSDKFIYSNLKSKDLYNKYSELSQHSNQVKVHNIKWAPYIITQQPEADIEPSLV
ncbi:MAG: DUF4238 domain-containing protein [Patescibacteria group bacterium]